MEISLKKIDSWISIDLNGRMDSFNFELVTSQFNTLLRMGKKNLILDLSDVVFLSLPSLRFFSSIAKQVMSKDGRFVVLDPSEKLLELIGLFNSEGHFKIISNLHELDSYSVGQNNKKFSPANKDS